jgi:hypothetical protein
MDPNGPSAPFGTAEREKEMDIAILSSGLFGDRR